MRPPCGDLPKVERQDHHRADAHRGDQEAHRMRRGTHAEHRGIDAVDHHRGQDPDVAAVERQVQQRLQRAVRRDDRDADQRQQHAGRLPQRRALAEQRERPDDDDQRPGRLQQQHVERGGAGQADIGHRVVGRDAGRRQQQHHAPVAQQDRRVLLQVGPGEADRDQERAGPAPVGERDRRHHAGDAAAKHDVAGPEQVGEDQQGPGGVPEPHARVGQ